MKCKLRIVEILLYAVSVISVAGLPMDTFDKVRLAREAGVPVTPSPDGNLYAEAQEFVIRKPGWRVGLWGENYFAATFANTFLSRKMYLEAAADATDAVAEMPLEIAEAGRYLVLARYEAPYNFQSRFRIQIEQDGKVLFDRLYGALENEKIWAFGRKIKTQAVWNWGAVENMVWEGHEAEVALDAGKAVLRLLAQAQPAPAARRNVDLVMLTRDREDVTRRIETERYLPLDGLLTQQGDVFLKLSVPDAASDVIMTIPPCREHSPYWVHLRTWEPKTLTVPAGASSEWEEIGSLLDSLNDSHMYLTARPLESGNVLQYHVEIGRRMPGRDDIETIAAFDGEGTTLDLIFPASVRYNPHVVTQTRAIQDLLAMVNNIKVAGRKPERTTVHAFIPVNTRQPDDSPINRAAAEFAELYGISPSNYDGGYAEMRYRITPPEIFEEYLTELKATRGEQAARTVSFGDEISLAVPGGEDADTLFREWLKTRGIALDTVEPNAQTWDEVTFNRTQQAALEKTRLFYYSSLFAHDYGIARIKQSTDHLLRHFPEALSGANFSPHHGYHYLHDVHQWVRAFRERALLLPWSEGYAWQVPIGSQQMLTVSLALLRAGLRERPADPILWYVMTHTPGNTPASWRREFYTALAYGSKIINLYQFQPLASFGTTENYSEDPAMYAEVKRGLYELGTFEDFLQDGIVRDGRVGFWFSEASDIWRDQANPFGANKRGMYMAMLQRAPELDVLISEDALNGVLNTYEMLVLTDRTVDNAAASRIAEWVENGGRLIVTAGAGTRNEYNEPNSVLSALSGQTMEGLRINDTSIRFIKQDLPWAEPTASVNVGESAIPVFGTVTEFAKHSNPDDDDKQGYRVLATFSDGGPAMIERTVGKGSVVSFAFLPALSYFKPAIPMKPVDRGATDDAMAHFVPTDFCPTAGALLDEAVAGIAQDAIISNPLVAFRVVESKHGLLVPLTNWTGAPDELVELSMAIDSDFSKVELASGEAVQIRSDGDRMIFTFSLDIADALILHYAGN